MLDPIGFTEGAGKGDGYNETVAYGAYTGGDVVLVSMNPKELDVSPDEDASASEEQVELVGSRPVSDRSHDGAQQPQDAAGAISATPEA